MTLQFLTRKSESTHSFPSFLHPSSNESVKEASEIRIQRATDLVRQPSRWGTEPLRVVGPDTRGNKATLNPTSSTRLSVHPISSSGTAGDGLNILSEACAAISTPRFYVSKDSTASRPDRDAYSPPRRTHLPPSSEWILETQSGRDALVVQFRDASPTMRPKRELEVTAIAGPTTKFATYSL